MIMLIKVVVLVVVKSNNRQNNAARLSSNGHLDLDTSLDVDDDLLDGLGGSVEAFSRH
jgi:hypothetical protein